MQGIKDDRFCATLTIYLTVWCFMQLNTSMEITGKRFFQTTPFNLYKDPDYCPKEDFGNEEEFMQEM